MHWNISQTKIQVPNGVGIDRKKSQTEFTDYVVLTIWAIAGPNFDRPVVKMVANVTGRVLILLPVGIYSVTCLNRIALGPNFSAGLDRDPDYKGWNSKTLS